MKVKFVLLFVFCFVLPLAFFMLYMQSQHRELEKTIHAERKIPADEKTIHAELQIPADEKTIHAERQIPEIEEIVIGRYFVPPLLAPPVLVLNGSAFMVGDSTPYGRLQIVRPEYSVVLFQGRLRHLLPALPGLSLPFDWQPPPRELSSVRDRDGESQKSPPPSVAVQSL